MLWGANLDEYGKSLSVFLTLQSSTFYSIKSITNSIISVKKCSHCWRYKHKLNTNSVYHVHKQTPGPMLSNTENIYIPTVRQSINYHREKLDLGFPRSNYFSYYC